MWRSSGPSRGTHPLGAEGAAATRTRGDPKPTITTEGTARRAAGPAVPVRGCAVVVAPPRRRLARVARSSLVAPRDAPRRGSPSDSPAFCKRRAEQTWCHEKSRNELVMTLRVTPPHENGATTARAIAFIEASFSEEPNFENLDLNPLSVKNYIGC